VRSAGANRVGPHGYRIATTSCVALNCVGKYKVIYFIGTSGDFVASARRLRFLGPLRTRAGSATHYAIQELA
jgi:hypothetical protein